MIGITLERATITVEKDITLERVDNLISPVEMTDIPVERDDIAIEMPDISQERAGITLNSVYIIDPEKVDNDIAIGIERARNWVDITLERADTTLIS